MERVADRRRRRLFGWLLLVAACALAIVFLRRCEPPPVEGPFDYFRAKAAELEYDRPQVVGFVRTRIRTQRYRGNVKGALGTLWEGAGSPEEKRALALALWEHCRNPGEAPSIEEVAPDFPEDPTIPGDGQVSYETALSHRLLLPDGAEPRETEIARAPAGAFVGNVHTVDVPGLNTTRIHLRLGAAGEVQTTVDTDGAVGEELVFSVQRPEREDPIVVVRELWRADNRCGPTRPLVGDRHDFVVLPCRIGDYVREKEELRLAEAERTDAPEAEPYLSLLDYCLLSDRLLAGVEEAEGVEALFSQPRILIYSRFNLPPARGGPCEAIDLRLDFVRFEGDPVDCYAACQARSFVEAGLEQFWLEQRTGRPCLSTHQLFTLLSDDRPNTFERRLRVMTEALQEMLASGPDARVLFRAPGGARVEAARDGPAGIALVGGPMRGEALEKLAQAPGMPRLPLAATGLRATFAETNAAALAVEVALSATAVDPPPPPDYLLDVDLVRGREPLLVPGARFAFAWGEGDERTEQEIRVLSFEGGLSYRWRILSGARPAAGRRTVATEALEKAVTHNPWYRLGESLQKGATSFVLSRHVHAELAAGRSVEVTLLGRYGPDDDEQGPRPVEWSGLLHPAGKATHTVAVNGRPTELPILLCRVGDTGETIGVLDDPRWPVGMADRLTAIDTTVRGRLVDEEGVAFAGATLTIGESTCPTRFDGSFRLDPLAPEGYGKVGARVERDGQTIGEVELDLTAPGLETVTLQVPRPRRELVAIAPESRTKLEELPVSEQVKRHARRALDAGKMVLIPDRMLVYGAGEAIGFFAFDALSGETVGVLENGLHGSSSAQDEAWQSLVDSLLDGAQDISKEGLPPIHVYRGALIAWWAYSAYRLEGDTHLDAAVRLLADMDYWQKSTNFFANVEESIGGRAGSKAREKLAGMIGGNMDGDAAAAAFKIGYLGAAGFLNGYMKGKG